MTETKKENVPALRFPEFVGVWEERRLKEFSEVKRGAGSQYIKYSSKEDGGIRLIRIGDFLGSEPVYIEPTSAIKRFTLKIGDILIAGTGATAGITFSIPDDFASLAYSYNAPRIRLSTNSSNFIINYLKSSYLERQKKRLFTGNAQPFLDTNDIQNLKFGIPSLPEQEKIAGFLSAVDRRIEQLDRKRELLQHYKKGMMQKLFSRELRFKDKNGNNFPDWEEKRLGEVFEESRIKGNTGDTAKKITVKLWGRGVFYKDSNGSSSTQYYKRKSGQFIFSKLDFLNCAFGIIPSELNGFESTIDLPCFDVKEGYSAKFFLERIMQKNFYKRLGDIADGSRKAKRIHADTFLSFSMFMPHPDEQQKIASLLSALDRKIELVTLELSHAKAFKKGLLQQMFV